MSTEVGKGTMQQNGTRLAGKVAIVTGAGARCEVTGTGQATAILFARQGAKVLLADLDESNAAKTHDTIKDDGGEASIFVADVTKNADCQAMVEAAVSRYGGLHILFNNAGLAAAMTVVDVEEAAWDRVVEVNLKGTMLACKHAIPQMIASGSGSIINISSIDGMRAGWGPNIPYAAAKGGVIAMTRNMAVHHGRDNIRVNSIAPGHVWGSFVGLISDELRDLRKRGTSLGTEGTAWDVAWAGVFLASDEARWISGVVLPVDAGTLAATPLALLEHLR